MREIRTLRCDVEGTGNVAWSRYCDTRRRKSELTVNTNFDLNRRASPRPYLREAGGAIPSAYSPNLRKTAPQRRFMPKLPIRHPQEKYYPTPGQARGIQVDLKPDRIGLRYPVEVGLTGDVKATLQGLLPLLQRKSDRSFLQEAQGQMADWNTLLGRNDATSILKWNLCSKPCRLYRR